MFCLKNLGMFCIKNSTAQNAQFFCCFPNFENRYWKFYLHFKSIPYLYIAMKIILADLVSYFIVI